MKRWATTAAWAYVGLTTSLLAVGAIRAIGAPVDPAYGPIQKLLYLHLPVAANTFLAAMAVFVASVGYISERRAMWDDLGHAAAAVALVNGTVLLVTGMFWAKVAWGQWWVWSPRLTFSFVLWVLYAGYMLIRVRVRAPERRAIVSAIYGALAFLDVPLLYLSAKLLPDVHPAGSGMASTMHATLWIWMAGVTLLSAGMIAQRFRLGRVMDAGVAVGGAGSVTR